MDEEISPQLPNINYPKVTAAVVLVILLIIILRHNLAFQQKSTVVLPAGGTYLGPKDTPTQAAQQNPQPETSSTEGKFTVSQDTPWVTIKGNKYPYTFRAPKTLKLVTFPGENTYDIYAISWNNQPSDQNVLIGVDNLNNVETSKQYITISKRTYVENWYKQFGGLKGVASVAEFTNSNGLKGYRAKYLNTTGVNPTDDIFFEVANPALVIHMASGVLASDVFNKIIDSVAWNAK
jgi:hypothetical protein